MAGSAILILIVFGVASYALGFAAGTVLVEVLARPWRRTKEGHWTELARLAFAPGAAVVWLAALLPVLAGTVGSALAILDPGLQRLMLNFVTVWLATLGGVMTARYRWLREIWGTRVTLRSWLAGCLVILLALIPHLIVTLVLFFLMPDTPDGGAAIVFGGGVLAVAFFLAGGGVLLLRLLGVARAAPPALVRMVEQLAQEMSVPGRLTVFQLEWAQVNAIAWPIYRAVGFSRALLDVMGEEEQRAVAAHELAHLLEPRKVRLVRVAHMFAYLPAVPLLKYGGAGGILGGYLWIVFMVAGYKRFTRKLEQRADTLECQAIGDRQVYMRSMVKLHQANLTPAVMPGVQTHPHLYDRLLAAGIQPDFPKPMPPPRGKPFWAAFTAAILVVVALAFLLIAVGVALRLRAKWGEPS